MIRDDLIQQRNDAVRAAEAVADGLRWLSMAEADRLQVLLYRSYLAARGQS